jgi:hypothetical protein
LDKKLNILEVGHTPLVIPPTAVVNKGTEAILDWLKKNEKEVKAVVTIF